MILEVKHLQLVEAVAAYGSLTNAGKHLHLTQSALSHQLVELERRLGTPLFHRVGRRLVPTLAGDRLLRSATRTLNTLRRTENSLKRIAAGREAVLRFSTACYTTYHWLAPLLEEFARRCPKVDVQVVAEATRRPIEALLAGKIDVGIVTDLGPDDRLQVVPLFDDEIVLIMPPRHRFASRPYVTAQDIGEEHLLVYTEPRADNSIFRRVLDPAGVVPRRVSAIQLTEAIVEMVKAGLGVAALARWAVAPHVRAGSLVAVPVTPNGLHRKWQAATLRQQTPPLYIREFCHVLADRPSVDDARLASSPGDSRLGTV
jgi:LysR family transcriptional regulator for metE and metH